MNVNKDSCIDINSVIELPFPLLLKICHPNAVRMSTAGRLIHSACIKYNQRSFNLFRNSINFHFFVLNHAPNKFTTQTAILLNDHVF